MMDIKPCQHASSLSGPGSFGAMPAACYDVVSQGSCDKPVLDCSDERHKLKRSRMNCIKEQDVRRASLLSFCSEGRKKKNKTICPKEKRRQTDGKEGKGKVRMYSGMRVMIEALFL